MLGLLVRGFQFIPNLLANSVVHVWEENSIWRIFKIIIIKISRHGQHSLIFYIERGKYIPT